LLGSNTLAYFSKSFAVLLGNNSEQKPTKCLTHLNLTLNIKTQHKPNLSKVGFHTPLFFLLLLQSYWSQ